MSYIEKLFSVTGKVAIVTGSGRGNGKAIADGLHESGATVIGIDILEQDSPYQTYHCDLSIPERVNKLIDIIDKQYGTIDILVNNAGISVPKQSSRELEKNRWDKTLEINLTAPYVLCSSIAEIMKRNGGGSIINITSLNSELAFPDNPAYIASKGALKQLTKSIAYDYGNYGVRANNIGPGYMKTSMTQGSWNDPEKNKMRKERTLLGRWGFPEDLIGAVIFLSSEASSFITAQDLYVDGGWLAKGL
jgi:NAD(P)-dependent dehydrogenase (short-subunit alcohol dehydrogenase family)